MNSRLSVFHACFSNGYRYHYNAIIPTKAITYVSKRSDILVNNLGFRLKYLHGYQLRTIKLKAIYIAAARKVGYLSTYIDSCFVGFFKR